MKSEFSQLQSEFDGHYGEDDNPCARLKSSIEGYGNQPDALINVYNYAIKSIYKDKKGDEIRKMELSRLHVFSPGDFFRGRGNARKREYYYVNRVRILALYAGRQYLGLLGLLKFLYASGKNLMVLNRDVRYMTMTWLLKGDLVDRLYDSIRKDAETGQPDVALVAQDMERLLENTLRMGIRTKDQLLSMAVNKKVEGLDLVKRLNEIRTVGRGCKVLYMRDLFPQHEDADAWIRTIAEFMGKNPSPKKNQYLLIALQGNGIIKHEVDMPTFCRSLELEGSLRDIKKPKYDSMKKDYTSNKEDYRGLKKRGGKITKEDGNTVMAKIENVWNQLLSIRDKTTKPMDKRPENT
ncbi:MAG: hypothetical protein IJK87_01765 [Prevotella sp.]|nr:hypothetical protein [Prevotella sp.]